MIARPGRAGSVLLLVGVCSLVVAVGLALAVTHVGPFADEPAPTASAPSAPDKGGLTPAGFLERYVADDGRVVRRDQGGDTVSEGQAYALLIAVGADDRRTFAKVWDWTRSHLRRDDGLLSWRWQDGTVQDPSSAADADLDMARALVVGGRRFGEPTWTRDGVRLGTAILDHETVTTPDGRVLTAGSWASSAPYAFNPSYVSPAATRVLAKASGDDRWEALESGSRAAVQGLAPEGHLPPDWAQVQSDGSVNPAAGPGGQPVVYGYDAARTVVRSAESCVLSDRQWAARTARLLDGDSTKAVYDLGGSPQTTDVSPLGIVAAASADAAGGSVQAARSALVASDRRRSEGPTYYGDAWSVLGRLLLTDPALGGCPPLHQGGDA